MSKTRVGKRSAGSDLNHENWDAEEETEERGQFQAAPADVISKRVIKVAKRRMAGSEEAGTGGLFKSFTGFSAPSASGTTNSTFPAFNFGANSSSDPSKPFTFSAAGVSSQDKSESDKAEKPSKMSFGATPFGFKPLNDSAALKPKEASVTAGGSEADKKAAEEKPSTRDQHLHSLRDLNIAVNKWISSHVEKNPYCDLSPVFADYEKHLKEIEKKYPYEEEEAKGGAVPAAAAAAPPPPAKTNAVERSNGDSASAKPLTVPFNFGMSPAQVKAVMRETDEEDEADKEEEKKDNPLPTINFKFGSSSTAQSPAAKTEEKADKEKEGEEKDGQPKPTLFSNMKFNFGQASGAPSFPFTGLASWKPPTLASAGERPAGEEEEYVPPKPEVREIKEDGSVVTKRCKLYYKWEDAWVDKGVGNVHVKPLEEEGKLQFLIRADTNLGTILLNVMVTAAIPISRNKTNLTLICVPTPPMTTKAKADEPMPLLVRFKTEADAEAVLGEVDRLRKKD